MVAKKSIQDGSCRGLEKVLEALGGVLEGSWKGLGAILGPSWGHLGSKSQQDHEKLEFWTPWPPPSWRPKRTKMGPSWDPFGILRREK